MVGHPKHKVIIYWSEEDEAFLAEVPELPGCMANGSTYAEAVANVEVVVREWLETAKELGRKNPELRGRLIRPMDRYSINIFYSEEDEGYIADIPDLRFCSAFGETPAEALAEVQKAKEAWLEVNKEIAAAPVDDRYSDGST